MDEHRIAARRRLLKAGTIEFGGGGIDCTVRNLSETGAALEVVTPLFIPDRFTLFVATEQLKRPCRVVWRKENGSVLRSVDLAQYDCAPFAPNIIVIAELPEEGSCDADIEPRVIARGSFRIHRRADSELMAACS